jgi:hypothetical protein
MHNHEKIPHCYKIKLIILLAHAFSLFVISALCTYKTAAERSLFCTAEVLSWYLNPGSGNSSWVPASSCSTSLQKGTEIELLRAWVCVWVWVRERDVCECEWYDCVWVWCVSVYDCVWWVWVCMIVWRVWVCVCVRQCVCECQFVYDCVWECGVWVCMIVCDVCVWLCVYDCVWRVCVWLCVSVWFCVSVCVMCVYDCVCECGIPQFQLPN